jgi:hypothetical protein
MAECLSFQEFYLLVINKRSTTFYPQRIFDFTQKLQKNEIFLVHLKPTFVLLKSQY